MNNLMPQNIRYSFIKFNPFDQRTETTGSPVPPPINTFVVYGSDFVTYNADSVVYD